MATQQRIGALLDERLINELSALYPHRCPSPADSEREVWMKAGERRVVDFLIAAFGESTETLLATNLTGQS